MYIYSAILWNKKVIIQGFCQSKYIYSNSNTFVSFFFFFFHVENKALAFGITSQLHFIPEVTEPLEQLVACKCAEQEPDHKQKHTWSLIG